MAKSIIVRLKKTKHKSQTWVFEIDMPGPQSKETKAERFATQYSAKRGSIRQLGIKWQGVNFPYSKMVRGIDRNIVFILDARKVTKRITNPVK
jgi:hypothetical protein